VWKPVSIETSNEGKLVRQSWGRGGTRNLTSDHYASLTGANSFLRHPCRVQRHPRGAFPDSRLQHRARTTTLLLNLILSITPRPKTPATRLELNNKEDEHLLKSTLLGNGARQGRRWLLMRKKMPWMRFVSPHYLRRQDHWPPRSTITTGKSLVSSHTSNVKWIAWRLVMLFPRPYIMK
jgi:hypothetical protein